MAARPPPPEQNAALVQQFTAVVPSCSPELAAFYLDANNWDLESAMSSYYEGPNEQGEEGRMPGGLAATPVGALGGNLGPFVSGTGVSPLGGSGAGAAHGGAGSVPPNAAGSRPNGGRGGIATLGDLAGACSEESEEGEDGGQSMFAGGKQSAMAVQNPGRKGGGSSGNHLVDDILRKAAQAGPAPAAEDGVPQPRSFVGTGYRLGSESAPSESVTPSGPSPAQPLPTVSRVLTFWRNGFSVDDGPLYAYDDPANAELLAAINSGQAPLHVLNVLPGQPVDVKVAKRQGEDFVAPKAVLKPFSGGGQRLGGVASGEVYRPALPPTSSSPSTGGGQPHMSIDSSLPVTSLQIRLADGTRMVSKFNTGHTIADVRNFINASRMGESQRSYVLQTTFPTRDLENETLTLKDAGLLNAVVVQRPT